MTGAELLAIARHDCPPGTSDYTLALAHVSALGLLLRDNLKPSQAIAVQRQLGHMLRDRDELTP
jgi:hypothetical protein